MGKDSTGVDEVVAVKQEVDRLRERTQSLVVELEQRVHEGVRRVQDSVLRARAVVGKVQAAVDLPAHARRHPRVAFGVGATSAALAVAAVVWIVRDGIRSRRPGERWRRRARAYGELLSHPERLSTKRPGIGERLIGALAITLATAVAREAIRITARRVVEPLTQPQPLALPPRFV